MVFVVVTKLSTELSQLNINKVYANFCSIVGKEMKQKLKLKVIVISNSINMNKKKFLLLIRHSRSLCYSYIRK